LTLGSQFDSSLAYPSHEADRSIAQPSLASEAAPTQPACRMLAYPNETELSLAMLTILGLVKLEMSHMLGSG